MKLTLARIQEVADDLTITQSEGNPQTLRIAFTIGGIQFTGLSSCDIAGVYAIQVQNPNKLLDLLTHHTCGEKLDIEVKI